MNRDLKPPPVSHFLQSGFHVFIRSYLRRHFHSVAVADDDTWDFDFPADQPLLCYCNHPSWWDPVLVHYFNKHRFPERQFYAPIDADALKQYQVFKKLGFFGVSLHSTSGASAFLKQSRAIVLSRNTVLWITPEGRFADVRDRGASLMPGLAHLCSRLENGFVVPMALEYPFWEERLPEALCKMGKPISIADSCGMSPRKVSPGKVSPGKVSPGKVNTVKLSKEQWQTRLTNALHQTQAELESLVIARDSEPFRNLLSGQKGGGPIYDSMRRIRAFLTGQPFKASHGNQFE